MEIINMTFAKIYRVNGVTFEWHDWYGPTIINRHNDRERKTKNISLRNWAAISKFLRMGAAEKESHRLI